MTSDTLGVEADDAVRIGPRFVDDFNGDTALLLASIEALLSLHASGSLSHPIPGLARQLLNNAAARLEALLLTGEGCGTRSGAAQSLPSDRRADALSVGLDAEPSAVWRPIESAPRDGTWFLACATQPGWRAMRLVRFAHATDRMPTHGEGNLWPSEPTHWMPLPSPPSLGASA